MLCESITPPLSLSHIRTRVCVCVCGCVTMAMSKLYSNVVDFASIRSGTWDCICRLSERVFI